MENLNYLLEPRKTFCREVKERLAKHGRITRAAREMGISRAALYQFINEGATKASTLIIIVKKFAGNDAKIEDYIESI